MKELEVLLENFWIIKEKNTELYHAIKDASPKFKEFLEEKLGYRLIINPYLIKLEKLPGRPEAWMGISDFGSVEEYCMFCLLLSFLEDRGPGEQFVLSQITEYVQSTWPGDEKPDWTLFRYRRCLVKVLRFAAECYIIRVDDGDEGRFIDAQDAEVLYESTGLSRYFVRNFTTNILGYSSWRDIEAGEWLEADRDRGRVRRNRVYRRLVMSPAVYNEGEDDTDYAYIKNYRNLLQKDFEDMLDTVLHVHKNGAFMVLDMTRHWKDMFPDGSTMSNIVLQVNKEIVDRVASGQLQRRHDDIVVVSKAQLESMIEKCRNTFFHGWSKEYREMTLTALCGSVIEYMEGFGMLETVNGGREIHILPMCGKVTGSYPEGFGDRKEESL
ncbi:MAG: TIGR02678 family protein [Clostridia bacterium]|nr:TIGR02678 family protein [Clostridia bacterium]